MRNDVRDRPVYKRDLLEKAKDAQEPVTEVEVSDKGRTIRVHAVQESDGVAYRAMVRNYKPSDSEPTVKFACSHCDSEVGVMRDWSQLATGRLSGPKNLSAWESIFTVFNAALHVYNQEVQDTDGDSE